jgi:hypothetical protein
VAAYAQICKDAIYLRYTLEPQESLQVSEIVGYKYKATVMQNILFSIRVLIKSRQASLGIQVSQDLC